MITPETIARLEAEHRATVGAPWQNAALGPLKFHGPAEISGFMPDGDPFVVARYNANFEDWAVANVVWTVDAHDHFPALLEAAKERDALKAEVERLREEAIELHRSIFDAECIGPDDPDERAAGWEEPANSDAQSSADRLVELGVFERHPTMEALYRPIAAAKGGA